MARRKRRARGHIESLPTGSPTRAIVNAGVDPLTGKERYLRETAKEYDEAEKALARLQVQVDEQRQPKAAITRGQAIDKWLEVAEHEALSRERIEDLIRLYIGHRGGSPHRLRSTPRRPRECLDSDGRIQARIR